MATFRFSQLANGQHVSFADGLDALVFDAGTATASDVRFAFDDTGISVQFGGKTVWLDGASFAALNPVPAGGIRFGSNDSYLYVGDSTTDTRADVYGNDWTGLASAVGNTQVWGLEGADHVVTGSGRDWLVGNGALTPLNHVSRSGSVGSPTASSAPTVSADGRFVGFAGGWTAFGSTDNSSTDVFVKDMSTGAVSDEHRSAAGTNGRSGSGMPAISADGQWLVFQSSSSLVPGTPPSGTLYLAAVGGPGIQAISTTTGNAAYADRGAYLPDLSADGRYVVFSSDATNLAAGSTSAAIDVFMKDVVTGNVVRISTNAAGTGDGNGDSGYLGNAAYTGAKISADGRYVVFQSAASNLTSGDTNGRTDVFLWDRNGSTLTNLTATLATVSNPNNDSVRADVAFDRGYGGYVVFETARNLVASDTSNGTDIYRININTRAVELVSSSATGVVGNLSSGNASMSGDGRFVVFSSAANNLVAGDTNGVVDVFVKDMETGAIALVSKSSAGVIGNQSSGNAQISLGGDWIVFESSASNLAGTDANAGGLDVFRISNPLLRDTLAGGAGNDTYVVDRAESLIEAAGGGTDTVKSSINWTLGANFENLELTGTASRSGTGNTLNNLITGNAGNNVLNGGDGVDTVSYANATGPVTVSLASTTAQATGFGSDTLSNFENITGSAFNDRLTGNALANRLDGGLGGDTLTGGAGNDTYVVNMNTDIVVESVNAGTDTVVSAVTWTLGSTLENLTLTGSAAISGSGNNAANVLTGNAGANRLTGHGGSDTLDGGAGNDTLTGGEGSDRYYVDSSADITVESGTTVGDIDTVHAGVDWTLQSTLENLTLTGTAVTGSGNSKANVILGNAAANRLSGATGNDTLGGGSGNDTIEGGSGADRLTGGSGNDVFALSSVVGSDAISDFVAGSDDVRVRQSSLRVGDGDLLVEGAVRLAGPGGFASSAELVIVTGNAASLSTSAAAAAIGSASTAYTIGRTALFAIDDGTNTGVYLFTAADANAQVSAGELTLLATLTGTTTTTSADYMFSA